MTGTSVLPTTRLSGHLHNGGFQHRQLGFHVSNLARDAQEILPEMGAEDLADGGLNQMFPAHPQVYLL